jgi:hypothetical protein
VQVDVDREAARPIPSPDVGKNQSVVRRARRGSRLNERRTTNFQPDHHEPTRLLEEIFSRAIELAAATSAGSLGIWETGESKMTDIRIRCFTVLTIALGMATLASNQAIPQSAVEKKMRTKAANEKKKADAAAKKAKAGERPQLEKMLRDWHFGDSLPTDNFGGGFALQKNYDPDSPSRTATDNDQPPPAEGTYEYLKQQVVELKRGQRPGGYSKGAVEKRQRAVDNLKALGPAAIDAVPALGWAAVNERDKYVKRRAMEILGDIGGMLGMVAVSETLLQPGNDPETAKAAEDSLLNLLPAVGSGLTMNDAIFLWEVHRLGNERVSPAIESAWAASGITQDAMARETKRRALAEQAIANAKANAAAEAKQKRRQEREAHDEAALRALRPQSPFGPNVPWKEEAKTSSAPKRQNRENPDGTTKGGGRE